MRKNKKSGRLAPTASANTSSNNVSQNRVAARHFINDFNSALSTLVHEVLSLKEGNLTSNDLDTLYKCLGVKDGFDKMISVLSNVGITTLFDAKIGHYIFDRTDPATYRGILSLTNQLQLKKGSHSLPEILTPFQSQIENEFISQIIENAEVTCEN